MAKHYRKDDKIWKEAFGSTLKFIISTYGIDYQVFCNTYHCSDATFRYWMSGKRLPQIEFMEPLKEFLYDERLNDFDKRGQIYGYVGQFMSSQGAEEQFFFLKEHYPEPKAFLGEVLVFYRNVAKHNVPIEMHYEKGVQETGRVQAIVFDFDGTLTKDKINRTTWEKIWIGLGYSEKDCQELHQRYNKKEISHSEWCKITEEKFIERHLHKRILDGIAGKIHLMKGVRKTFKKLYNAGIKIYIVSGSIDCIIKEVLGDLKQYIEIIQANNFKFDEDGYLAEIVGTRYDFEGKSYFITKIAEQLNISPKDILFIGNSINDRFAYQSGAKTLCINPVLTDPSDNKVWHNYIQTCENLEEIFRFL